MKKPNRFSTKSINAFRFGSKKQEIAEIIPLPKLFYITLLLNVLSLVGVFAVQSYLPPEVPLFYGLAEGEDQLTTRLGLFAPNLISMILTLANLLVALLIGNEFLKKILIVTGFSVSALSLLTTVKIILLVGAF